MKFDITEGNIKVSIELDQKDWRLLRETLRDIYKHFPNDASNNQVAKEVILTTEQFSIFEDLCSIFNADHQHDEDYRVAVRNEYE